MTNWGIATSLYLLSALGSFVPTLIALLKKVPLNPGGETFKNSVHFSEPNKLLLEQHYTRIYGTLIFWKNKAEVNRRFHFYTICWTIPISILIPIILQTTDSSIESKLFLTIISCHSALLVAFHRALKVENNYKAFRQGESEFYDLYRRLLDRPQSFGDTEERRIENYFIEAEKIRKIVRNAETDNFPMIEEARTKANNN